MRQYRNIHPDDYPKSTPKSVLVELDTLRANIEWYKKKLLSTETGVAADGQFGWDWYSENQNLLPEGERPFVSLGGKPIYFYTSRISRKCPRLRLVITGDQRLVVRPRGSNEILIEQESY